MRVSEELNDEQVKQLHFDLENGYNLFMRSLDE
jgi:ESCRT-I complex subunit VPS28